jgi:hypothetical protein
MASATITELPLRLQRVEPDPFIESMPGSAPRSGDVPPGGSDAPMEPADERRVRGRLPELAA